MKSRSFFLRVLVMVAGLFIGALGFSFALKADFGVSAMGCCPAVFSAPLGISVGTSMWIFCTIFIVAQILILRRDFPPFQLLQLAVAYLYGLFSDLTSAMLGNEAVNSLCLRVCLLALGLCCTAICVFLLLKADLLMMSPEAMLSVITSKYGLTFSKLKVTMDCSMVAVAVIGSLAFLGKISFVGIGTLASATIVGNLVGFMQRQSWLNQFFDNALCAENV